MTGSVFDRFTAELGYDAPCEYSAAEFEAFKMCPLWITIGKAALSETRVMWYAR